MTDFSDSNVSVSQNASERVQIPLSLFIEIMDSFRKLNDTVGDIERRLFEKLIHAMQGTYGGERFEVIDSGTTLLIDGCYIEGLSLLQQGVFSYLITHGRATDDDLAEYVWKNPDIGNDAIRKVIDRINEKLKKCQFLIASGECRGNIKSKFEKYFNFFSKIGRKTDAKSAFRPGAIVIIRIVNATQTCVK
ncbi:MAG: hypothetical protein IJB48_05815 [Clostridia bacterium]|nr:hypothetical protein [Clostridia bacterium]MBQ4143030.1 hypothetical protein [Thermoguttaceae bacterium]